MTAYESLFGMHGHEWSAKPERFRYWSYYQLPSTVGSLSLLSKSGARERCDSYGCNEELAPSKIATPTNGHRIRALLTSGHASKHLRYD
jgi:hypothetical protein